MSAFRKLFGDKDDLIVIHNMGRGCSYCTMWADGFNGLLPHLEDRAAFVVASPDSPEVQKEFATGRGWRFRMASAHGTSFNKAAGFEVPEGPMPGVSTFRRDREGRIYRVSKAEIQPGDDFCSAWHLFDLLEGGPGDWGPSYTYCPPVSVCLELVRDRLPDERLGIARQEQIGVAAVDDPLGGRDLVDDGESSRPSSPRVARPPRFSRQ